MSEYKWKPFTILVSAEEVKGNEMKISVGDTVVKKDGSNFSHGKNTATVEKIDYTGVWFKETGTQLCSSKLEKYSLSPIRTVTRREIVPGVYGRVHVGPTDVDSVVVSIGGLGMVGQVQRFTAEELREAAHILNQLAEALEDNGE